MQGLNYHHLYYFWMVAREGSIARATTPLGLTQPTISGQLRLLERQLGQKLFDKRGRNLVLTELGNTVFRYAEEIFALGRELNDVVAQGASGRPPRFAVGISDALPKVTTYRLLEPALALDPPFRLTLRIDKTERLVADLSIHALDLVLSDTPVAPTVKVRAYNHLLGESAVTVFGTARQANRYRDNFPASLDGAPFLLPTDNTTLRRSLDQWFATNNVRPNVVGEVEDFALLQLLGQRGAGLFAAPSVVEDEIVRQYGVKPVGTLEAVRERFYALSIERRLKHPAVLAISEGARADLFG